MSKSKPQPAPEESREPEADVNPNPTGGEAVQSNPLPPPPDANEAASPSPTADPPRNKGGRPRKYATEADRRKADSERRKQSQGKRTPVTPQTRANPTAANSGSILPSASLASLFSGLSQVAASRFGKHWELKPEEAEALGKTAEPLLDKYGGQWFSEYGVEIAFGIALVSVFLPRLGFNADRGPQRNGENDARVAVTRTDSAGTSPTELNGSGILGLDTLGGPGN